MPLPVPRLTATVHPPARRHELGTVVGTLGARVLEPEAAPAARGRVLCSVCDVRGHSRNNRKYHPKVG